MPGSPCDDAVFVDLSSHSPSLRIRLHPGQTEVRMGLGLRLGLGNSVEQLTSCRPPKEASARARRRGYPAMQRLPDLSGSGSIPLTSAPDEAPWPWSAADLSVALGNVVQQHSFTHPVVVSSRCSVLTWKIKGGGGWRVVVFGGLFPPFFHALGSLSSRSAQVLLPRGTQLRLFVLPQWPVLSFRPVLCRRLFLPLLPCIDCRSTPDMEGAMTS